MVAGTKTIHETLEADSVVLHLPEEKEAALTALVRPLARRLATDESPLLSAVLAREAIMTTGMGHGVAVPHAKIAGLKRPILAIGISGAGIEYGALDGSLVKIVALFLTPQENPKEHVKFLADLTKRLKYAHLRTRLLEAKRAEDIVTAFQES